MLDLFPIIMHCNLRLQRPALLSCAADFDLEGVRHKLDQEGLSIAENQELSLKSRRGLADTTRSARPADHVYGTWCSAA